jgi:thiamine monophosphate synthase
MQFNKLYKENFFFFTTYINEEISKNVVKFKNIAIIYNNKYIENENNFLKIKNFCRKNNIKFFIIDDLKLAIKYKLDGIILSNKNKSNYHKFFNHQKNLRILGKVQSQIDLYFKIKQNCNYIILSPIFENTKYKENKILKVIKFNLISNNWGQKLIALGGVNQKNLNKIKMTKASGIGFMRFISSPEIKKPVLFKNGLFNILRN